MKSSGASCAGVRIGRNRNRSIFTSERPVSAGVWRSPGKTDPFDIAIVNAVALLPVASETALTVKGARLAAHRLSTSGSIVDLTPSVGISFGQKHAVVVTYDRSYESSRQVVTQSEARASRTPQGPEAMPQLGGQQYVNVPAYFESTASLDASDMERGAMIELEPACAAKDLQVTGFIVTSAGPNASGNDEGLFACHRSTSASYVLTVRAADGSGSDWAGADHRARSRIDLEAVSERAVEQVRAARGPAAIEPGRHTAILEPQAAGDPVLLVGGCSDARSADEGRGPFAGHEAGNTIGETIVDGGSSSFDDTTSATERDVLVTRLSYPREVDPRTILYTGLTRDGTFPVDDGTITDSIRNRRFDVSPLFMLNNLEMLGRTERLAGTEACGDILMPTLEVRDFEFTSLSEAV